MDMTSCCSTRVKTKKKSTPRALKKKLNPHISSSLPSAKSSRQILPACASVTCSAIGMFAFLRIIHVEVPFQSRVYDIGHYFWIPQEHKILFAPRNIPPWFHNTRDRPAIILRTECKWGYQERTMLILARRIPYLAAVVGCWLTIPSSQGYSASSPFTEVGSSWTAPLADTIATAQKEFLSTLVLPQNSPISSPPCTQVNSSWASLVNAVLLAEESLTLCPFHIIKPLNATLVLEKRIRISCLHANPADKCIVEGEGNHIRIRGSNAEVVIQSMRFENATNCAIRVAPSASRNQLLHECEFVG